MPRRPGFRRSKKPSLPFIQLRQYRCIALPQLLERIFINHPQNYDAPRPPGIPATSLSARNRFSYWLLIALEDGERVRRAIAALPSPYLETLVMRDVNGLSYREIADATEAPIGTVMSRLARARALLAKTLRAEP